MYIKLRRVLRLADAVDGVVCLSGLLYYLAGVPEIGIRFVYTTLQLYNSAKGLVVAQDFRSGVFHDGEMLKMKSSQPESLIASIRPQSVE